MKKEKIRKLALPVLAAIMLITLPILAYLQYEWIGDLSEREKEHLKNLMETSGFQYSMKINQSFINLQNHFYIRDYISSDDSLKEILSNKYQEWSKSSRKNMITSVYLADSARKDIFFLVNENRIESAQIANIDSGILDSYFNRENSLRPLGFPNRIYGAFQYLLVPVNDDHKKVIILQLNPSYVYDKILDKELLNYFPESRNNGYVVAFSTRKDTSIIYSYSYNFEIKNKESFDMVIPFGMLPPVGVPEMDTSRERRNRHIIRFAGKDRPGFERNRFKYEDINQGLLLMIAHKGGSLESEIAAFRTKNLIISFSILSVLAIASIIIIIISAKSTKLARQQMQFIAYLPHELRTPLTVIKTASENISDGLITDSNKFRMYGNVINKEVNKLWEMIENALMYAGINSDKASAVPASISVDELIHKSLECLDNKQQKESIIININNDLPEAYGNPAMLIVALRNLVTNAVKYGNHDSEIVISADYDKSMKKVFISVKDNGMGIDPYDMKHIFEPFYRSNYAVEQNISGNGIGLSLVKRIAEMYGGFVTVQSKSGIGSIFTLTLQAGKNGK